VVLRTLEEVLRSRHWLVELWLKQLVVKLEHGDLLLLVRRFDLLGREHVRSQLGRRLLEVVF